MRTSWDQEPVPTDDPWDGEITQKEQEALLERVAQGLSERGLGPPAIFLLEASKPLSFIASQGMVFLGPFVDAMLSWREYHVFTRLIEDRPNIERLIRRLEALEEERTARRRAQ